ncbi:hypothetical protein C3L33_17864, partial [Rhododendron williamsianum]
MATSFRRNPLSSRIKALLTPQRLDRTLAESGAQTQFHASMGSASALERAIAEHDVIQLKSASGGLLLHRQKKAGFKGLGFDPIYDIFILLIVLKILQGAGFDAYLVGGCVRDLLLNKVPKDFDVVTTATLKQIKKEFYRCLIVGQRFPICHVHVKGSVVEVSGAFTRILRGLRIAARLGLSLSKETEIAIHKLSSSIAKLSKTRIMLELNYMLSYGAAEPSLCLLQRFNLLDILLPFHAAYLAQQDSNHSCQSSVMLMKLFFNLDKLVTAIDLQIADCGELIFLVGLLAFHLALVNHPQDALAVWTFASVLYHGTWKEGVKFAIEHAQALTSFIPEISEVHHNRTEDDNRTEDELAQRVTQLASLVQDSIGALTETDILVDKMSRFPDFLCSDVVYNALDHLFLLQWKESFNIDYELLRKGDEQEMRFVLGRIVMDTMSSGVVQESKFVEQDRVVKRHKLIDEKCNLSENGIVKMKNSVATGESKKKYKQKPEMIEESEFPQVAKKHEKIVEKESRCTSLKEITQTQQNMGNLLSEEIDRNQLPPGSIKQQEVVSKKKKIHFLSEEGFTENGRHKQDVAKKKPKSLVLSRLFR